MTVPTALERLGNFSQTLKPDENGQRVPARIFDPFNVTQVMPDLYRRAEIPNAIITNPDPYGLHMFSFYPLPNRTPDDVYNTNNFEASTTDGPAAQLEQPRRLAASAGIRSTAAAASPTPRSSRRVRSATPFNGAAGSQRQQPLSSGRRHDRAQPDAGARPSLRLSRINTKNLSGDKEGLHRRQYDSFGVPATCCR